MSARRVSADELEELAFANPDSWISIHGNDAFLTVAGDTYRATLPPVAGDRRAS